MAQTSREIVVRCLEFEAPQRMPRDLWVLPWAVTRHGDVVAELSRRFPSDFVGTPNVYQTSSRTTGNPHAVGTYIDEWGCEFVGIQAGVIGEVRRPLVEDLGDWQSVEPPYEILPVDRDRARTGGQVRGLRKPKR